MMCRRSFQKSLRAISEKMILPPKRKGLHPVQAFPSSTILATQEYKAHTRVQFRRKHGTLVAIYLPIFPGNTRKSNI